MPLKSEILVYVCDTRLSSLSDKSELPESLRKCLIVKGTQAHFVLGWTGLATTDGGHHTADWLFQVLYEMNAVELSPEQIIGNLINLATARFRSLDALDLRCHFLLGGWHKSEPFIGDVSNYVFLDSPELSDSGLKHHIPSFTETAIEPEFRGSIRRFKNLTAHHYHVDVVGDCNPAKLKTSLRGLEGLLKKRVEAAKIVSACRQIALEAGRYSQTIGKDLIAVEMDRAGNIHSSHYSEQGTEVLLVPDFLGVRGGSTHMALHTSLSEDQVTVRLKGKIIKRAKNSY